MEEEHKRKKQSKKHFNEVQVVSELLSPSTRPPEVDTYSMHFYDDDLPLCACASIQNGAICGWINKILINSCPSAIHQMIRYDV